MRTGSGPTRNNEIRALFFINTPAQAHTWRYVIDDLLQKGHKVEILAREYGSTPELLADFGFRFHSFKPIARKSFRILEIFVHLQNGWCIARKFNPTVVLGFGVDAALMGFLLRRPGIIFTDMEPVAFQNFLNKIFASAIVTPSCFKLDMGKKQVRINGYKELFYLHPSRFRPDPAILSDLGVSGGEKYILMRFNAFDAVHDVGKRGLSLREKYEMVKEFEKYCRVFISPEEQLPEDLQRYVLPVPFHRIHHVLYYASLYIGDGGTMATESALLGTPVVHFEVAGSKSKKLDSTNTFGNIEEMVNKYGLIYTYTDPRAAARKALEIIQDNNSKKLQQQKKDLVISSKIDAAKFMISFIEEFHQRQLARPVTKYGQIPG